MNDMFYQHGTEFIDCYKILELERNSTDEEIRTKYRKLAEKYHPDMNQNISEEELKEINDKMSMLNIAYNILKNYRKEYNAVYDEIKSNQDEDDNQKENSNANNETNEQSISTHVVTPKEDEDLIEVEKVTAWEWVKDHKKEILIAIGITTLTITAVVTITQLLPAIVAATKATQVAGLAGEMVANGQLWFTASASEKVALHSANTALANIITSLTGTANTFNTATGVWTLGAQGLPQFAQAASIAATNATSKVAALKAASIIGTVGGFGSLAGGLIAPQKRSETYKKINNSLKELYNSINTKSKEEILNMANAIKQEIISSQNLSSSEKNILLRKYRKILQKLNKMGLTKQNTQQQPINSEQQSKEQKNEPVMEGEKQQPMNNEQQQNNDEEISHGKAA